MKNLFIHYPGFDPVKIDQLRTFNYYQDDIRFSFFNKVMQRWTFDSARERNQAFAFLLDQYTDQNSSTLLESIVIHKGDEVYENYVHSVTVTDDELIIERQDGAKDSIELGTINYHSIILDVINNGEIKLIWKSKWDMPYPFNKSELIQK